MAPKAARMPVVTEFVMLVSRLSIVFPDCAICEEDVVGIDGCGGNCGAVCWLSRKGILVGGCGAMYGNCVVSWLVLGVRTSGSGAPKV